MFSDALKKRTKRLLWAFEVHGLMIAAAESCTGGLIAALLTEMPGSSAVFERGFVTYSNEAKTQLLGVPAELIARHGAVSRQVAAAMAEGALAHSGADIAVAVTGVAGPGGGTKAKPVGLVYVAVAGGKRVPFVQECRFTGGRSSVRLKAAAKAIALLSERLSHFS